MVYLYIGVSAAGAVVEGDAMERIGTLRSTAAEAAVMASTRPKASASIERRSASFLELGLSCEVHVTTAAGESGIPLPDAVTITGSYSPALAACIEKEVGIPAGKQNWLEVPTWTETKDARASCWFFR